MPRPICTPCCNPAEIARSEGTWRSGVLQTLCDISTILAHEDFEVLCDPGTGVAVLLVPTFNEDGTIASIAAYNLDGTVYVGVIADLVSCGGAVTVAGLLYPEDSPHVSGDTGVFPLSVRSDVAASTADTDGDYAGFITDADGRLWTNALVTNGAGAAAVNIQDGGNVISIDDAGGSITVDGTVTSLLASQHLEDDPHVSGDTGIFALSVRSDAAASTAGTDGDYAGLITDSTGRLWTTTTVLNGAGAAAVNIQDGGNSITIDDGGGSITVDGILTFAGQYAEDTPHVSGDLGLFSLGVRNTGFADLTSTTLDYSAFAVAAKGALYGALDYNIYPDTNSPVRIAGQSTADSQGIMVAGARRQDTPVAEGASTNTLTSLKVSQLGGLWVTVDTRTSDTPASNLLKDEDSAHTTGSAGVQIFGVRSDTPASRVNTDGDYINFIMNSLGAVYTEAANQVATFTTLTEYAAASILAAYSTALTNSAKLKFVSLYNATDADVYVSFDGATNHDKVLVGEFKTYDFATNSRWMGSNISVKRVSGAATTGTFDITAYS